MKHLLLLTLCFAAVCAYNLNQEWQSFKRKYRKTYSDTSPEGKQRKKNFEANLKFIEEHNKRYEEEKKKKSPAISYKLSVTNLADLSYEEFINTYTSKQKLVQVCKKSDERRIKRQPRPAPVIGKHRVIDDGENPPEEVDWRQRIQMSPVQDQGDCGCCWAFASIGAIEAHFSIRESRNNNGNNNRNNNRNRRNRRNFEKLSEQELIDCVYRTRNRTGCDGGLHYQAFDYAMEDGISPAESYPNLFPVRAGQCNANLMRNKRRITGYRFLDYRRPNEEELKKVIAFIGPVATHMATPRGIMVYGRNDGVYNDPHCNESEANHYVLVVGYGVDPKGGPYWLIKNSWSEEWGDGGYMKLARDRGNLCHIATEAFYPLI